MTDQLLLTPGPSNTSARVKEALGRGDECPREADFVEVVAAVRRKLVEVLVGVDAGDGDGEDGDRDGARAERWEALPVAGSGTAAVEAALASLVPPDGRVLVLENGAYGRRAGEILAAHDIEHRITTTAWTRALDPAEAAGAIEETSPTHVFVVHHETTAGVLNPLAALARVARAGGAVTVVDAMSSFGGIPLGEALPEVDVVVSSANKCVQGVPGVAFVLARGAVLDAAAAHAPRSVYLDLLRTRRQMEENGQLPFTPPVQVLWGLDAALDELLEETVEGRNARYRACYEVVMRATGALGVRPMVEPAARSGLITAFLEPDDEAFDGAFDSGAFDFVALHDRLREAGVTLYPGKVPSRPSFRIGTMGAFEPDDVAAAMERFAEAWNAVGGATP